MSEKNWITVEINTLAEKEENPDLIVKDLQKILPQLEVFLPLYWHRDSQFTNKIELFPGYIFVTGAPSIKHYFLLENSKYVNSILATLDENEPAPYLTPNEKIEELKQQLSQKIEKSFELDDIVKFLDGQFKNLKGKVISIINDKEVSVQVLGIKSARFLVQIEKVYLEKVD